METLKSTLNFYVLIIVPLLTLVLLSKLNLISDQFFVIVLLLWALIYHPYVSGKRLMAIGKIKKEDFLLNFIPFWNMKFFDSLFFNR